MLPAAHPAPSVRPAGQEGHETCRWDAGETTEGHGACEAGYLRHLSSPRAALLHRSPEERAGSGGLTQGGDCCVSSPNCVQLRATPRTAVRQAPLSMGFPRQGCWSGLPFPPPEDLSDGETAG